MPTATIPAAIGSFLATDVGLGATLGPLVADVGIGAAGGAGLSALTGGDPLTGALTGGITGGFGGIGGDLSAAAGLGSGIGDIAGGAVGGLVGGALTGSSNLGLSALEGGAGGALSAAFGGTSGGDIAGPVATASPSGAPVAGPSLAAGAPAAIAAAPGGGDISLASADPTGFSGNLVPLSNQAVPAGAGIAADAAAASPTLGPFPAQTPGGVTVNASGVPSDLGGGGAGNTSGIGGFFNKAVNFVENNPLSVAGIGILGADMLMGNQPTPAMGQLQSLAGSNAASSAALESYVQSGKLPPGMQQAVDLTTQANEASIRSTFARMGLSGSTQEAQAIAGAKEHATAQIASIAQGLLAQGVQLSGISGNELAALVSAQAAQDAGFQSALGRFAGGLAGARMTG